MTASQRGFAALELVAGVALLVLPVTLLVLSLPEWSARQSIARQAAREAARAVTLDDRCDLAHAAAVVDDVAQGAGLDAGALPLTLDCPTGTVLARGGTVTARVSVRMPALTVPGIGAVASWTWTATHTEPVDPYGSRG